MDNQQCRSKEGLQTREGKTVLRNTKSSPEAEQRRRRYAKMLNEIEIVNIMKQFCKKNILYQDLNVLINKTKCVLLRL